MISSRGLSLIPEVDVKKPFEELDEYQQSLFIEDDTLKKRLLRIKQKGLFVLSELKVMSERVYQVER